MLQQTQVDRVREKYLQFLKKFPRIEDLGSASLSEVLYAWQGLGYNRRAKFLKESARQIMKIYHGKVPKDEKLLIALPGIGKETAGSIRAFAHNLPTVFIETNIRRVYIHEFFSGRRKVSDEEIRVLVKETLPSKNIREWYYALMDYGAFLGKELKKNPNIKSRQYRKQSRFEGSERKLRGEILRILMTERRVRKKDILKKYPDEEKKINHAVDALIKEKIIVEDKGILELSKE